MPGTSVTRRRKLLPPVTRLKVWQIELAEWLAQQTRRLPRAILHQKAMELSGDPMTQQQVTDFVYRNVAFREYKEALATDLLKAARHKMTMRADEAVDAHFKAISWAVGEQDHKNMSALTNPILDRIWPKKSDEAPVAAVQVILTQKQHTLLDTELPTVEYEVVVPTKP